ALDSECDFPSHVGMQGLAAFQQVCPLARIDHDHTFRMVDDPGIRWKPVGPVRVAEYREPASQPAPPPFDLCGLDPDRARLDRVEFHAASRIDRTIRGWSKWTMWPASGRRTTVVPGAAMAAGKSFTTEAGVS